MLPLTSVVQFKLACLLLNYRRTYNSYSKFSKLNSLNLGLNFINLSAKSAITVEKSSVVMIHQMYNLLNNMLAIASHDFVNKT